MAGWPRRRGRTSGSRTAAGWASPEPACRSQHLLSGTFVQTAAGTFAVRMTDAGNDALEITGTARLAGTLAASFQTTRLRAGHDPDRRDARDHRHVRHLRHRRPAGAVRRSSGLCADHGDDERGIADARQRCRASRRTSARSAVPSTASINTPTNGMLASLPDALTPLYDLTSAELPGALSALSGEAYASEQSVLIGDSLYSRQAILGRLRQGLYGAPERRPCGACLWRADAVPSRPAGPTRRSRRVGCRRSGARPMAGGRTLDGDSGLSDVSENFGGLHRRRRRPARRLAGRRGDRLFPVRRRCRTICRRSFDVDSMLLAVYAGTTAGPWNVRLGASYAFNQIDF